MGASAPRTSPTARKSRAVEADPLDQLVWYLGRAYYTYVGLLESMLAENGLDQHVRPGMGHVLFTLFATDDLTIKEIAERSQLACSTLTGLLKRMEAAKLIERRRDERDGRSVRVRLTQLGRSLEPRCQETVQRMNRLFTDGLSENGVQQAKNLLRKMIVAMRSAGESLQQD